MKKLNSKGFSVVETVLFMIVVVVIVGVGAYVLGKGHAQSPNANGGNSQKTTSSSVGACNVSPNPTSAGASFTVSATNVPTVANAALWWKVQTPYSLGYFGASAAVNGTITFNGSSSDDEKAGTNSWSLVAASTSTNGKNGETVLFACTQTVQ